MRARVGTKEKVEFAWLMAKHSSATLQDVQRLMRYGATLGRIAENQCNGYQKPGEPGVWDGAADDADRRKKNTICKRVVALCGTFGVKAVFQSDPRGATLKIAVRDGYSNDMGREGICVPTS